MSLSEALYSGLSTTDSLVGLKVTNTTRSLSAIITAFDGTDTLTLASPGITGQVSTDTYNITCEFSTNDTHHTWSYVDEANSTTNYGTATVLLTRGVSGTYRWPIAKFDLSQLSAASITKITFWLRDGDSDSETVTIYNLPDTDWTNSGVTWDHQVEDTTEWTNTTDIEAVPPTSITATIALNTNGTFFSGTHADLSTSANSSKDGWWSVAFITDLSGYGSFYGHLVANSSSNQRPFVQVEYTQ
jgi:hypothetical protein